MTTSARLLERTRSKPADGVPSAHHHTAVRGLLVGASLSALIWLLLLGLVLVIT